MYWQGTDTSLDSGCFRVLFSNHDLPHDLGSRVLSDFDCKDRPP